MAKGSGNTRASGPSRGKQVDQYAAWRAAEGSEKYTYDTNKVRFDISMPEKDLDGTWLDGFTDEMLRHKAVYDFSNVQRGMSDGKFNIGRDAMYYYSETMTFNQAVNRTVQMIKDGYRNNEGLRDSIYLVDSEDSKAPTAWVWAELKGDNKVRIMVSRHKPQ